MCTLKKRIKEYFSYNQSYDVIKIVAFSVFIISLLAYNRIFLGIVSNPDGLAEGFYYYSDANWASAGCGRWFIRYFNLLHANIVSPGLIVIEYCLFHAIAIYTIVKTLGLKNRLSIIASVLLFTVTPTVISQFSYTCTAAPYAFAEMLSALFVYFAFMDNKCCWLAAVCCLAISLGGYQSYVGLSAALTLMVLIVKLINGEDTKELLLKALRIIALAIISGVVYFVILKIDLYVFGLSTEYRMAQVSLTETFRMLPSKFVEMYGVYFRNFNDGILKRNYLYFAVFVLDLIIIGNAVAKVIIQKELMRLILVLVAVLLIPPVSNIVGIIIPFNNINTIMCQQNWLLLPFMLCVLENISIKHETILRSCFIVLMAMLSWTYVLSANATYIAYEHSYRFINSEMNIVLNRLYDLDEFDKDNTKVVMAGFPDESIIRDNDQVYKYAIDMNGSAAFWLDVNGAVNGRRFYFLNMLGFESQILSFEEYDYIINTREFYEMPVWPAKGSVSIIDGYAVIKFSQNPPMVY